MHRDARQPATSLSASMRILKEDPGNFRAWRSLEESPIVEVFGRK